MRHLTKYLFALLVTAACTTVSSYDEPSHDGGTGPDATSSDASGSVDGSDGGGRGDERKDPPACGSCGTPCCAGSCLGERVFCSDGVCVKDGGCAAPNCGALGQPCCGDAQTCDDGFACEKFLCWPDPDARDAGDAGDAG